MKNFTMADVLRAEAFGVDLQDHGHEVEVAAMRENGTICTLGYVSAGAIYQDPDGARRAIAEIKFGRFRKRGQK